MESVGEYLKTQRMLRDVAIKDVSEETKIAVNWLEAIENDNWDMIPCETFARGFLKAYAKSLGLEVEDVITRYDTIKAKLKKEKIIEEKKKPSRKLVITAAALITALIVAVLIWFL